MDELCVKCLLYADDHVILAPSACRAAGDGVYRDRDDLGLYTHWPCGGARAVTSPGVLWPPPLPAQSIDTSYRNRSVRP
ncbi:hypothetical protein EVAR_68422_1 [Eumeta japonica]|uniref:Reverse transcriptase domain-containing protein n=1 Tax=Eumeta variegata TaxID=151549 RepID=A0A4C1ZSW5_EUMVA|nr:hypothetical protein EVAR_68422_1 [Eumeta japonica]